MAVNRKTLRLLDGMRVAMLQPVDAASEQIIKAWGTAWNELAQEWDDALQDLVASSKDGKWPSRRQVARAKRAKQALELTRGALLELATELPITVAQALPTMTSDAVDWANRLTASQYPATAGTTAQVMATFDKISPEALKAIVDRTTGRMTTLAKPLSPQAEQAMRSVLIRGIAVGDNPIAAAKLMLNRVEDAFNGGRNRALVIARTEMLDAHRAAGHAQDQANVDVLQGWQWAAKLDSRTCPSCWSKHGEVFPVDQVGPEDHQQGRCARLPLAKSWKDLGFDIEEPASILPDAQATFVALGREDQLAVMGKARLDLLDSGKASWSDLSTKRSTDGWRDSFAPTPVSRLAA